MENALTARVLEIGYCDFGQTLVGHQRWPTQSFREFRTLLVFGDFTHFET